MKIKIFLILSMLFFSNIFASSKLKGLNFNCTKKRCEIDLMFKGSKLPAYKLAKKNLTGIIFKNVSIASDTLFKFSKKSYVKSIDLSQTQSNVSISLSCKEKCPPFSKIEKIKKGVRFVMEGEFKKQKRVNLKLPLQNVVKRKINNSIKNKKMLKSKSKFTDKKLTVLGNQRDTIAIMDEFISKDSIDYLKFKAEVLSDKSKFSTKKSYSFQKQDRKLISTTSSFLYTSPNLMSEKLEPISVGREMKLLSRHGIWVKVLFGRIKGFIPEAELAYEDELFEGQREKIEQYILLRARRDSVSELSPKIPPYFVYSSFGKRDPFLPIALPEIDGISMDELRLVAIIWNSKEPMAILQDVRSEDVSYNLQEGDRVINGKLSKILPNEVIFTLTEFGVTRNFSMILPHLTEAR